MSHEEIVRSFIGSRAVDFNALGKFVSEYGESIAISGRGDYGVRIGFYNVHACFKIALQRVNLSSTWPAAGSPATSSVGL